MTGDGRVSGALYIGDDKSQRRSVFLGENLRNAHMHIIGRSNTGKTSHLLHMIQNDIINGRGLCVIDMLGNLYPRLVAFLAHYGLEDRTILFDPSDSEYSPGLNYLDTFDGSLDDATVLETAMEGIMRVYREQNEAVKPRWETYAPLSLMPLIKQKLTLLEVFPFVSPDIDTFRRSLLEKYREFYLQHGWQEFDSKTSSTKKFELIEVVYNRGMRFWPNLNVRRIVGQTRNFINWRKAMDEGKVVLCNLGSTPTITDKQAQMLGVMILHQIVNSAKTRRGDNHRRFYLYVDEFPQILCKDFETAPDTLRNFGVSLILAHQRLAQLSRELQDIDVRSAVMANARVKEVFNVSQEDAEIMAKEVFALQIHGDEIKYQGMRTLLIPHQEIIKLRSSSSSDTSGFGTGDPTTTFSEGVIYDDDGGALGGRYSSGTAFRGTTGSVNEASGRSEGTHESLKTEYEQRLEPETPVFRSIEEKIWQYIRQIMSQQQRESILLFPGTAPLHITTPTVREYYVEEPQVRKFIENVHRRNGTLTASQVDSLIEARYRELLGEDFSHFWQTLDRTLEIPQADEDNRWQ
jgi:hypothetical protein